MTFRFMKNGFLGTLLAAVVSLALPGASSAQDTLRVAILNDINNFDPQSFLGVNFPLIKNFYDSLIEYDADGQAIPSLATSWDVAADGKSVTLTLREGVKFSSGGAFNAEAVAATLKKASDPEMGKNVYPTTTIIKDWTVGDAQTITINFNDPVPGKQITDLLQFISVIDPAGMDTVETNPAGTGAYMLVERVLGQSIEMKANPNYWRDGEPATANVMLQVFSDADSAAAALESGAVDMIYGARSRIAARLQGAGFSLVRGPGPLTQVFRINTTRKPFDNEKFRQAFNYLIDREGILKVGYSNIGEVTALPWAKVSPAYDPSYNEKYAFNLDKAKALLAESGLSEEEMSDWNLLVNGRNQDSINISQIVQNTLAGVGINIELELKQGTEYTEDMLGGGYTAVLAGVGNVQKFPSRVSTNSIYRTANNPILGEPHPFPEYVAAIERVNSTFGSDEEVKAAYAHLNEVLVESAFAVPTNTYDIGMIIAGDNLTGFTLDIDNMLVARTIAFK